MPKKQKKKQSNDLMKAPAWNHSASWGFHLSNAVGGTTGS
jgi:hypothetical protein